MEQNAPKSGRNQKRCVDTTGRSTAARNANLRLVRQLTQADMEMLTKILHLDNTHEVHGPSRETDIQTLIQELPTHLRRARPLPLGWMRKKSCGLCDLHRSMNADLVLEILQLIQQEVTFHFQQFDAYPEFIHAPEARLLDRLRAMKGLWVKPDVQSSWLSGGWSYQSNGCSACVIARVASNPAAICDLRVVLLSRTRTRRNPRQRSLTPFVEECMRRFGDETAEELFEATNHVSLCMKAVRKACTRAWAQDPSREHPRRSRHSHPRRQSSRTVRASDPDSRNHSVVNGPTSAAMVTGPMPEQVSGNAGHSRSTLFLNLLNQVSSQESQSQRSGCFGDLYGDIHSVLGLYNGLAKHNPYSRSSVVSEGEVLESSASPWVSKERMRELSYAAVNGTMDESMRREMSRVLTSSPLPSHFHGFEDRHSTVDVPVVYQYSASDYASEWTDDECEQSGSDYDAPTIKSPSPADTTWSLVCNEDNWI